MKRQSLITLSISFCLVVAGCQPPAETTTPPSDQQQTQHSGHSHPEGPHGGTVFDWGGGQYHLEFTVDHDKQESAVYILDSSCKEAVAIATDSINLAIDDPQSLIELTAKPLNGETSGSSSRFVGQHETLGIVKEFSGKVYGSIGDKAYSGNFKEEPHEHGDGEEHDSHGDDHDDDGHAN